MSVAPQRQPVDIGLPTTVLAYIVLWIFLTLMSEFKNARGFSATLAWLIALSATYAQWDTLSAEWESIFGYAQLHEQQTTTTPQPTPTTVGPLTV